MDTTLNLKIDNIPAEVTPIKNRSDEKNVRRAMDSSNAPESASKFNLNILKQRTTPKSVQSDKTKVKIIKNSKEIKTFSIP